MTDLKTLKDLDVITMDDADATVYVEDLKQEAIKWVKDMDKEGYTREWIKGFFNITEEDLR